MGVKNNTSKKLNKIVVEKSGEKKNCAAMPNICQNKQWWKVHSYKRLISIFEDDASELLFGLGLNCIEIQEQKGGGES